MKITKKTKVQASSNNKKIIKASKSADQMLDAFESKLAEFGIESCDKITSSEDVEASSTVFITDSDSGILYEDLEGCFGNDGDLISLAELKQYWNSEKDKDPELGYYSDFQSWLRDTVDNGFIELVDDGDTYDFVTSSVDVFDDVTEGELNSKEGYEGDEISGY